MLGRRRRVEVWNSYLVAIIKVAVLLDPLDPLVLSVLPFVTTVQLGSVMMDDRRPIVRPLALVQSSNAAGFLGGTCPDRLSARTPHVAGG